MVDNFRLSLFFVMKLEIWPLRLDSSGKRIVQEIEV